MIIKATLKEEKYYGFLDVMLEEQGIYPIAKGVYKVSNDKAKLADNILNRALFFKSFENSIISLTKVVEDKEIDVVKQVQQNKKIDDMQTEFID